jgi:Signal transduction histidine kinase
VRIQLGRKDPTWVFASRAVELTTLVVLVLAAAVQVISAVVAGQGWLDCLSPLVVLAGIGVAYRLPWLGLGIVACGPIVGLLGVHPPVATWSMLCFAALLLTLRGLSGLATGAVLAGVNYSTAAFALGTVVVRVDASAAVFAFAAAVGAATGAAIRQNIRYRREVEQRLREATAARRAAVDRGIAEERLQIARDLHDSVGHHVAVVNMKLGAAEVHLRSDPSEVRSDLHSARAAVREVLRQTQQILTVLRIGHEEGLQATPGHTLIRPLIESFREAGMQIDDEIEELGHNIPPAIGMAAYRIVQESLTNAHRYGEGQVAVTVACDPAQDAVTIEIVNARGVRVSHEPSSGKGLGGMSERAESVGGSISIRTDGPLFSVNAVLPATEKESR